MRGQIYRSISKWPIYYYTLVLISVSVQTQTLRTATGTQIPPPPHRNYFETDQRPHGEAKTVQLLEENEGGCLHDLGGPDHEGAEGNILV